MAVDGERLEAWLVRRIEQSRPMMAAVYGGVLARLRRGDFDEEQGQ